MYSAYKTAIVISICLVILLIGLYFSINIKADEGSTPGLSEEVKQLPDGTKVRLSGEKIDVDISKGTTIYQQGTRYPILSGYITNFTPDRIVTNMTFQLTFTNNHMLVFPLNHANTIINIPPWQTMLWNHIMTPSELKTVNPPDANKYGTSVLYNEIDIYKQHAELVLLSQIRSNPTTTK